MFKKTFLILILMVFALSGCSRGNNKNDLYNSIIKKGKLTVGISFDSKPFGFKNSKGQAIGLEVDLAREIAQGLLGDKNKVEFKDVKTQDRIKAVQSGDVDMVISTMTITPERKKIVSFSEPYFVAGQVICVRKNSKISSVYDLMNKKVIVELGTTGEKNIRHFIPNALIQGYINNSDAISAFEQGTGDAITTDDSLLQGLVMGNSNYIMLRERLTKEPYGIAFQKSRNSGSLRKNINKIIKEMQLNGTLYSIKNKWGIIN